MDDPARLPDATFVVRCGKPPFEVPTKLPRRCGHHPQARGVFGFSVQARADTPWERLASSCPNRWVGVVTVAEIRSMGYDVIITPGGEYHATVVVPEDWDQESAEVLASRFLCEANPSPRGR